MSLFIPLNEIPDYVKHKIKSDLILSINPNNKFEELKLYDIEYERVDGQGSLVHLPYAWVRNNYKPITNSCIDLHSEAFLGTLRENQQLIKHKSLEYLKNFGSAIISAGTGFGKTIVTVNIICHINVPVIIFVKQTIVAQQWLESFKTYAPTKKVVKLSSLKQLDTESDVYIANPILFKQSNNDFFFKTNRVQMLQRIKFAVVDELHQVVSKVLHKAFFKITPDYFLGLSATPFRPANDPMSVAIKLFFGEHVVVNPLFRKHTVYVVRTKFQPDIKINQYTKKLDWNYILNQQALNEERNRLIIKCIENFPTQTWLVLVKRVEHAKILGDMLNIKKILNCILTGTAKTINTSANVIIGTTNKIGTGFDYASIDGLIIATDCVEYFEQFLGRCMRRPDVEPIIIDFQDNFKTLQKHLDIRLHQYEIHGGIIQTYNPYGSCHEKKEFQSINKHSIILSK